MKIEKRDNSVFVSHEGLTVFFNRYREGSTVRVTTRDQQDVWHEAGKMNLSNDDLKRFADLLGDLAR